MEKLNHQSFESWLLSEESLTPDQTHALQEHLRVCESCRKVGAAWTSTREFIQVTPLAAPAPGFAARWQAKQAEVQRLRHRRQIIWFLSLTSAVAWILMMVLAVQAFDLVRSPYQLFFYLVARLMEFLSYIQWVEQAAAPITRLANGFLPLAGVIFGAGLVSLLSVLWLVLYQQLTQRRIRA